ncbi:hypothetical protein SADUNF_Sadunf15G0038000 [Salix dunnii]|uniref:Uncharacterized protein n=1 Tax=Salix dunnii TaxID=1413687 RepID=A0A835JF19_9ROSI|nr:hypothetical protein SADUNF_Sadunf15G0038000 [Salix dunnii]
MSSKCFQWGLSTFPLNPLQNPRNLQIPFARFMQQRQWLDQNPQKFQAFILGVCHEFHRDDWEGLGHVTQIEKGKHGVSVAADKSSFGVVGGLEIIEAARTSELDMMIVGVVETNLSMGFAGHLAAGFDAAGFLDWDNDLWSVLFYHLDTPIQLNKNGYLTSSSHDFV